MPASDSQRGSVFAIGGHELRDTNREVLAHFVSSCGGPGANLVVLSAASREPLGRRREYDAAFRTLGVEKITHFHQEYREEASDPALLAAIDEADGVFFTGGSQLKLVSTIGGTPLAARLHARHLGGLHLAGTSAGASAMSAVMIARGVGRVAARLAAVRMAPGLGFLRDIIVDQHFQERERFGRLFAAVLCNPSMLGFGLDESTAFSLDATDTVSVFGIGTLTIVDGAQIEVTNINEIPDSAPAAFAGLRIHCLRAGWSYDLATRRVDWRSTTTAAPLAEEPTARLRVADEDEQDVPRLIAGAGRNFADHDR